VAIQSILTNQEFHVVLMQKYIILKRYILRKVAQEHKVLLRRKKCNTYSSDVLLIGLSNDL
jgi:hypothetical protein